MVEDEKLLKKYKEICGEIKNIMKRNKFDSDSVFASKYLKVKIKSYNIKITITFHIKAPKEEIKCVCPAAIVIDSVFKSGKNC